LVGGGASVALSFIIDHEQTRRLTDWLFVTASGRELVGELDGATFSNTWVDPITNTLMLAPSCVEPAWDTSNSGDYAKLSLSAFTFGTSANWEERQDQRGKGPWIAVKDTAINDTAITTASYSKNQGFCVSWFGYGSGESFIALRCGWNNTASAASGLSGRITVEFYSDGAVNVLKGNTRIASGKITGADNTDAQGGQFFKAVLLPFRHRELLVLGFKGSGFAAVFEDILSTDTDPTITPAANFWFTVPTGGAQVQLAPLRFATSGYFFSQKLSFADAPATGATLGTFGNASWVGSASYRIWGHPAYVGTQTATASLYEHDGVTAFVPNDTRQNCRIRVDLTTSNAGFTPFIYGASMAYRATMDVTDDSEEHDATTNVTACSLSVPDDAAGVQATLEIRDPEGLEADVVKFRRMANRPAKLQLGTKVILDGYGDPENWEVIHNPEAASMGYVIRDTWRVLDNYMFSDRVALDGLPFDQAVTQIVRLGLGATTHITLDISSTAYLLAPDPMPNADDFSYLIEAGDTAGDKLQSLLRDYAATWIYGFRPRAAGLEFFAKAPADLPSTPILTLYTTRADAETALAPDQIVLRLEPQVLEPEGTEVRVTGVDPRTNRPFQAFKVATTLEDPTLAPSLRPDGWVGEKRKVGLLLPEVQSQDEVNRVTDLLYDRLTVERELIEWESDLLVFPTGDPDAGYPLWRGDLVEIDGLGEYRIISFGGTFIREATGVIVRRFTYVGEKVT
jgi:hypothetical protein